MTRGRAARGLRPGVVQRGLPDPRARGGAPGRGPGRAAPLPRGAAPARNGRAGLRGARVQLHAWTAIGSAAGWTAWTSSGLPADAAGRRRRRPSERASTPDVGQSPALPGLHPERVTITDYKSSDVRDPARARERARESLQLQIYAMAYQAETGRLPGCAAARGSSSRGWSGRVEVDEKRLEKARESIRQAAAGIRARRVRGHAGLPGLRLLRLPRHLPGERGQMIDGDRTSRPITFDFGNTLVPFPAGADGGRGSPRRPSGPRGLVGCSVEEFVARLGARSGCGSSPRTCRRAARRTWTSAPRASWHGCAAARPPAGRDALGRRRARPDAPSRARCEAILDAYADAFVAAHAGAARDRADAGAAAASVPLWRSSPTGRWPWRSIASSKPPAGRQHLRPSWSRIGSGRSSPRPRSSRPPPGSWAWRRARRSSTSATTSGADVVGAHGVGWRTAWVRCKPEDSPLPVAPPAPDASPDLTIDSVTGPRGRARPAAAARPAR